MNSGEWSPAIPAGKAAVRAWRDLDRPVRRELMRSSTPYPDPLVAAVAVGYARTRQARGWMARGAAESVLFALPAIVLLTVVVVLARLPVALATLAAIVIALVRLAVTGRRWLAWVRMENVNASSLVGSRGVLVAATAMGSTAAGPVAVRADRAWVLRTYGGAVALVAVACAAVWALTGPAVGLPVAVVFGLLAVGLAAWGVYVVSRGPLMTVNGEGVESFGLRMAWPEITEVRIVPQRMVLGTRSGRRVVVFVAADPEAVIARYSGGRAWAARRCQNYYGGPIGTDDHGTNRTADEIAAAANALGGVPVRRLGESGHGHSM